MLSPDVVEMARVERRHQRRIKAKENRKGQWPWGLHQDSEQSVLTAYALAEARQHIRQRIYVIYRVVDSLNENAGVALHVRCPGCHPRFDRLRELEPAASWLSNWRIAQR